MQYLCLTKSRAGEVEMDDIGMKGGKILERSLSYILKPSKVEASDRGKRNILVCTEAPGEGENGLEVSILHSRGEEWQQML